MSAGTERTWRSSRCMSAIGATADDICSQRVFRLLTHLGHRLCGGPTEHFWTEDILHARVRAIAPAVICIITPTTHPSMISIVK
jgi:hypothetical protein